MERQRCSKPDASFSAPTAAVEKVDAAVETRIYSSNNILLTFSVKVKRLAFKLYHDIPSNGLYLCPGASIPLRK